MKQDGKQDKNITRRDFAKISAGAVVGLGALPLMGKSLSAAQAAGDAEVVKEARVCLVLSQTPIPKGEAAKEVFEAMLEKGLTAIADGKSVDQFMSGLFKADDRVAMKVNNYGFKGHRGPQLARAICERIAKAGVTPENIVIYENSDGALSGSGYKINHDGPGFRCYGTDYTGHMDNTIKTGAAEARYTKILEQCTALVNMPILKAHNLAGVSICMKNHYGSVENPRQFHGGDCDPFIADINTAPIISGKMRLAVCDAVKVVFAGGPEWDAAYVTEFNGILVSTDPVALDAIGHRIIKKIRKESGKKQLPYNPEPKQLQTAQKNGIGIADLKKIDFIQVTV